MLDIKTAKLKENIKKTNKKDLQLLIEVIENIGQDYVMYEKLLPSFEESLTSDFFIECVKSHTKPLWLEKNKSNIINLNKGHGQLFSKENITNFLLLSLLLIYKLHNLNKISSKHLFYVYLYLIDNKKTVEEKRLILQYLFKLSNKNTIAYLANKGILVYDFIYPAKNSIGGENKHLLVKRKPKKEENNLTFMMGTIQAKITTYVPVPIHNFVKIITSWGIGYLVDINTMQAYKIKEYSKLYHNI